MSETVHAGDLAEYHGTVKTLAGLPCEISGYTPTFKRVRCQVRLADGRLVQRLIKPDNLKRLGGGC